MMDCVMRCVERHPFGWYCTRWGFLHHEGPCALRPRFWNVRAWWGCSRAGFVVAPATPEVKQKQTCGPGEVFRNRPLVGSDG